MRSWNSGAQSCPVAELWWGEVHWGEVSSLKSSAAQGYTANERPRLPSFLREQWWCFPCPLCPWVGARTGGKVGHVQMLL